MEPATQPQEQPQPEQNTQSNEAPQTQPAGATSDPRYIKLLEDTIKEQNRRLQEAATSASSAPPPVPEPVKKTAEEERLEFYNDPMNANRRLIREELRETVGPLIEFVNQMKGGTLIDKMIGQFKGDPRFAGMWDSNIESYVRQQASTVAPAQLTEQTFGFLVLSAVGMKASGMLPGSSGLPTPPPAPAPAPTTQPIVPTPPHMRPTAPAGPSAPVGDNKTLRPLTEAEERIRRENGMTHEQFLKFQEMPTSEVAFTSFDKPKPK